MTFARGGPAEHDAALDALLLPFANGALSWPESRRVLFLRARGGGALPAQADQWRFEQSFKPQADDLLRSGFRSTPSAEAGQFDLVLVLPPRQRDEARALLARALKHRADGGVVVASMLNSEGARSTQSDLQALAGPVDSLSKFKSRVFWTRAAAIDAVLIEQWASSDAPRPIENGRFISRPGLFAWDRIDIASRLLVECLPSDLSGDGADLGAGFGYLSAEILERCPAVDSLDLFEAEARALDLARNNLSPRLAGTSQRVTYHWHDVTCGIPGAYDFVVSNPPFHQGRAEQPDLGRAFIAAASSALRPAGQFWLVANQHLPYEAALAQGFASVRVHRQEQGFKVIEARKASQ